MATPLRKSHFLIALIATWIDSLKRTVAAGGAGGVVTGASASTTPGAGGGTAPAFTGTAPTSATGAALATGTGYATAGQVVTTTETTFTATLNQYAGCWLLAATKAPCRIVSHPAATAEALALTVEGAAPATTAEGFNVYGAPTPLGAVASHTHTGAAHTHGAGTLAASPASGAFHYDRGEYTITTASASSLSTSRALLKAFLVAWSQHGLDALAHDAADTVNGIDAATTATNLAIITGAALTGAGGLCATANTLKADFNAHLSEAGVHPTNDGTNTIAAADATDQGSLNTLLNELKADFNLHIANGFATPSWRVLAD